LRLAGVLDRLDRADHLLENSAVLHHDLGQILVHDDVAGGGVDHNGAARAVERPALERLQRLVHVDLALGCLHHVDDGRHAAVALEAALECGQTVLAGREVSIADHRSLRV
jgi:hypothetical protein